MRNSQPLAHDSLSTPNFVSDADLPIADHPNLAVALAAHHIELEPAQIELLDRYRVALWRWNEQINLTRHTTFEKFVARDVLDSLELAKQLPQGRRVLDLGSGGGVPGIIIAICRPDLRVTLCDSVGKKAKVLQSLVEELGLSTEVFGVRVEELLDLRTFDVIVARAVAPMWKILFWLMPTGKRSTSCCSSRDRAGSTSAAKPAIAAC